MTTTSPDSRGSIGLTRSAISDRKPREQHRVSSRLQIAQRWTSLAASYIPWQVPTAWIVSRLFALAVALAASEQMPNPQADVGFQGLLARLTTTLSRWDGGWYQAIVQHGYAAPDGSAAPRVAFFPVYPLLVRATSECLGISDLIVAPLLSNVCALAAGVLLFHLVARRADISTAHYATLFLFFAPSSIHLSAYYTESLFLALIIGAFVAADRERWSVVALLGALASATRPTGFLLSLALLVNYWQKRGLRRPLSDAFKPNLAIAATTGGALGYALYLQYAFGSIEVYFDAQRTEWPRRFGATTFFRTLLDADSLVQASVENMMQGFLPAIVALVGGIWLLQRGQFGDATFVVGSLYVALGTGTFEGTQRYLLTLFPLYTLLASLPGSELRALFLVASGLLMGYWSALFGGGWHFT